MAAFIKSTLMAPHQLDYILVSVNCVRLDPVFRTDAEQFSP